LILFSFLSLFVNILFSFAAIFSHWTYISNTVKPPLGAAHRSAAALIRMCLAFVSFLAFSWAPWSLALVPRSCIGVAFSCIDLITLKLFQN
jgi:hypothetical protein